MEKFFKKLLPWKFLWVDYNIKKYIKPFAWGMLITFLVSLLLALLGY